MLEKRCSKCKEVLPTSEFGVNTTIKSGLHSWCRACVREQSAERRVHNPAPKKERKKTRGFTELRNCGTDYLKSKSSRGGILYYFPKPKDCFCSDGLECMHCWHFGSSKIIKDLKEDPDYNFEEQIIGVEKYIWEDKLKKHQRAKEI